jgi:acetoin utilization deacetylase AcuC-like enzyme
LTSGFHHAEWNSGGGFCTFNGLVIAAQLLRVTGKAKCVGIIDLDQHFGNGTEDIISKLGLDYIRHYTFGGHGIQAGESAAAWLKELPKIVCGFKKCDVILCQLGADPFIHDPLGGVLEKDEMRLRDRIVFQVARKLGIPVAWNLAGGYTKDFQQVLDIHTNSARECLIAQGENLSEEDQGETYEFR